MPKVIAMQYPYGALGNLLRQNGYVVVDKTISQNADAYIFTAYHPDRTFYNTPAHISTGSQVNSFNSESTLEINITGLSPDKVLSILQRELIYISHTKT